MAEVTEVIEVPAGDPRATTAVPELAALAALGVRPLAVPDTASARRARRVATVIDAIRASS